MRDFSEMHEDLQNRLDQLYTLIGKIDANLRQQVEADSEEQAISRENDEVLERLDESSHAELEQIRAALARLQQGTYGMCSQCRGEIAMERLKALPYATTCLTCAG